MNTAPTRTQRWRLRYCQCSRDAAYLLAAAPLRLVAFCIILPLLTAGVGTVIIWVGVVILVLALGVAGGFAALARRMAGAVDGSAPLSTHYLRAPDDAGPLRAMLIPLKDPHRWMDLAWTIVSFPVSLVLWVIAVVWLAAVLGGFLGPIAEIVLSQTIPDQDSTNLAELLGLEPDLLWAIGFDLAAGILFLVSAPVVLRKLSAAPAGMDRLMVTWRAEIGRLETSRVAASGPRPTPAVGSSGTSTTAPGKGSSACAWTWPVRAAGPARPRLPPRRSSTRP